MGVFFFLPFGVFVHTMKLYIGLRRNASRNRKLGIEWRWKTILMLCYRCLLRKILSTFWI